MSSTANIAGGYDDRYLSPYDGKIKRLVVQATDDIYDNTENGTWRRTFIRNISPFYFEVGQLAVEPCRLY